MDLSHLGPEEKLALVALMKLCVAANGEISDEENTEIGEVAVAIGEDEYRRLVEDADRRFGSEIELRPLLESIRRQEARDTIYGILLDATTGEAMQGRDLEVLAWLREAWQVQVKLMGDEPSA